MKTLCVGYFGRGNLGDDLYLSIVVPRLLSAGHEVSVLTRGPHPIPFATEVSRVDGRSSLGIVRAILWADLLLFPGGSVFQNVTSNRSLAFYLTVSGLAARFGKPLIYLSQGFGPVRGAFWRHLAVETLRTARLFVARDEDTARFLRSRGIPHVQQAADLSWLAPVPAQNRSVPSKVAFIPYAGQPPPRAILGEDGFLVSVEKHSEPLIYAFSRRHSVSWVPATTLTEWASATAGVRLVVSARFHPLILAVMAGIPVLAIGTDPKIRALALHLSLCWYPDYSVVPRPVQEMCPPSPSSDKLMAVRTQALKNLECLDEVTKGD